MNLPEPKSAPEVDPASIFAQFTADEAEWRRRAAEAQRLAAQAFARLLAIAETSDTGQARRAAMFLASTFNGSAFPFDLFELRVVDVQISDDMLVCLDALRWGKADLYRLVPNGEARVKQVIRAWGIRAPAGD